MIFPVRNLVSYLTDPSEIGAWVVGVTVVVSSIAVALS